MEKKILVIAGMHRSGTSLITQWLQRCGLSIGEELMAANSGNEQGYYEDMDFVRLHEEMLTRLGLPDTGLTGDALPALCAEGKQKMQVLLAKKSRQHVQWAWKDPRTCLFLGAYRELAADADCLVIYRDFQFCVYSLVNRMLKDARAEYLRSGRWKAAIRWKWYKKKRVERRLLDVYAEEYLSVWMRYNQEILRHIEAVGQERCTVVDYQSLLSDDRKVFDVLTGERGYRLEYVPFRKVYSEKLMTTHAVVEPYIRDKQLIYEANKLAHRMKALFTI